MKDKAVLFFAIGVFTVLLMSAVWAPCGCYACSPVQEVPLRCLPIPGPR